MISDPTITFGRKFPRLLQNMVYVVNSQLIIVLGMFLSSSLQISKARNHFSKSGKLNFLGLKLMIYFHYKWENFQLTSLRKLLRNIQIHVSRLFRSQTVTQNNNKNINIHEKLTHNKQHERDYLNISSIEIYTWSQGQVFCVFHIFKTNFYEIENRKYN
jgi:hypothetical protein